MAKRIFISYGTKDGYQAAEWLVGELKQRGYDAWWDKERLKAAVGASWELEIEREIKNCDAVIALLSPHAVRPDGECRHEISLARSHDRKVVPVVVKPCERPLRLHALQYVDLSGFEALASDSKLGRLQQILEFVERGAPEDPSVCALKRKFQRFNLDGFFSRHQHYVGRKWLMDRFDDWLQQRSESVMLLVGPPGYGKSAALAHWTQTRLGIGAVHFCRHNRHELRDPRQFVISVAAQLLASNLPGYAQTLEAFVGEMTKGREPSALDLMHRLVLDPLRDLVGDQRWVLVIDALDEAGEDLLRLFRDILNEMPRQVRFLMSARPEPEILRMFPRSCMLELDRVACDRDVQEYVTARLAEPALASHLEKAKLTVESAAKVLQDASAGSHLVAQLLVDEFASNGYLNVGDHIGGLGRFYEEYLERKFPTLADYNEVRQILQVLAACYEPVSDDFIGLILDMPTRTVKERFQKLGSLVPIDVEADTRVVFHRSFHEWLVAEREVVGPYSIDLSEGRRRVALKLGEWLSKTDPLEQPLLDGQPPGMEAYSREHQDGKFTDVRYAFRNFFTHMFDAGNYKALYKSLLNEKSIANKWDPFGCELASPDWDVHWWPSKIMDLSLDRAKIRANAWDAWAAPLTDGEMSSVHALRVLRAKAFTHVGDKVDVTGRWGGNEITALLGLLREATCPSGIAEARMIAEEQIKKKREAICRNLDASQLRQVVQACELLGLKDDGMAIDRFCKAYEWGCESHECMADLQGYEWVVDVLFKRGIEDGIAPAFLKEASKATHLRSRMTVWAGLLHDLARIRAPARIHYHHPYRAKCEVFPYEKMTSYGAYHRFVMMLRLGARIGIEEWRSEFGSISEVFASERPFSAAFHRIASFGFDGIVCRGVHEYLSWSGTSAETGNLNASELCEELIKKNWDKYWNEIDVDIVALRNAHALVYAVLACEEECPAFRFGKSIDIEYFARQRLLLDRRVEALCRALD